MRPGIFAKTFRRGSLDEVLTAIAGHGIPAIQFNLALTGGPSLPAVINPGLPGSIRETVAAHGLEMVAVSGTYNMAHPDPALRAAGQRALQRLIACAPAMGTAVVTVCTGTRDPEDMWRAHPANETAEAWADMRASVSEALAVAEGHGVTLGMEPELNNIVRDAPAARRLLDELRSDRLKIVFDAANLVPPERLADQDAILGDAMDRLGADVVLAHAKDVTADGTIVAAGRGDLDYDRYLTLLDGAGYDGAVVLHGLDEAEVGAAVGFLRDRLQTVRDGS